MDRMINLENVFFTASPHQQLSLEKRKRMFTMNSAFSLEVVESSQVDTECQLDSHGCKPDSFLLGGETWRHWNIDGNLKYAEQDPDEEISSNIRNSEVHIERSLCKINKQNVYHILVMRMHKRFSSLPTRDSLHSRDSNQSQAHIHYKFSYRTGM